MLSKKLLDKLKAILKEDYGEDLEPQEVSKIGNTLVSYFDLLAKFSHQDRLKEVEYKNEHNDKRNQ